MILLTLAMMILSPAIAPDASYERLSGADLKKFETSKGSSHMGRHLTLRVPGAAIDAKAVRRLEGRGDRVFFESKGIAYVAERTNPYLVQTQRKVKGKKGATLVVKGQVIELKLDGDKRAAVAIHSLQAAPAGPSRAP